MIKGKYQQLFHTSQFKEAELLPKSIVWKNKNFSSVIKYEGLQ